MVNEVEKLRAENKRAHEESKEHHESFIGQAQERVGDYAKEILSIAAVGEAIAKVSEHYTEWMNELKEIGAEHQKLNDDLTKMLAMSGQIGAAGHVKRLIEGSGLAQPEAQAAYQGVFEGTPGASQARLDELAKAGFKAAPLFGGDAAAIGAHGELIGRLNTLLSGASGEKLGDLAYAMQTMAGPKHAGELADRSVFGAAIKMVSTGAFDPEQALGFQEAAIQKQLPPRFAATLAAALADHTTLKEVTGKRGHPLTEADQATNNYVREQDAKARMHMLFANPLLAQRVLGGAGAESLAQLSEADIAARAATLRNAEGSHLVRSTLEQPGAADAKIQAQIRANKELSENDRAKAGENLRIIGQSESDALNAANLGAADSWKYSIARSFYGKLYGGSNLVADKEHQLTPVEIEAASAASAADTIGIGGRMRGSLDRGFGQINGLEKANETLEKQTELLERSAKATEDAARTAKDTNAIVRGNRNADAAKGARDKNGRA
ncbi:MAG TPA: hypothetical protein VGG64_12650 [Pirellulales bacterium]